ncbi:MAG: hypothetical protein ACLP1D_24105, partial [Xanthobacteraceae bacterium]
SWPGLSRPSTSFLLPGFEDVDARHKAGHDRFFEWDLVLLMHVRSDNEVSRRRVQPSPPPNLDLPQTAAMAERV